MGSLNVDFLRKEYPKEFIGKTDKEIAAVLAAETGYYVIVRYKSSAGGDYNNFGCCMTDYEVASYFDSPGCHDVEVVYGKVRRGTVAQLVGSHFEW
jgi:hypothetical protein